MHYRYLVAVGKHFLAYLLTIVLALAVVFYVLTQGAGMESETVKNTAQTAVQMNPTEQVVAVFSDNLGHKLPMLIIQIISIIAISRFLGLLFSRIGQPTVIGEILAGILLGPSLLGLYFPELSATIFPTSSLGNLQFLSQIGLILFMFVIGMELDISVLKSKAKDAIFISHVSIVFPFTLGAILAYFTFEEFAPTNIRFISFALFMGISMSVTAFPVLARIVQERGLTRTKLGTIVITSAAADDITAWCLLAVVIAIVKAGTLASAAVTIGLSLLYVLFMLLVLRPFLNRLGTIYSNRESISRGIMALVFLILLSSAWATEVIGIHALFGAFMAGVIMPPNINFRKILIEKLEDVALVLLLPLFFVYTGLRTQIGLLNDPELWSVCAMVIAVAVTGKFLGSALAAKYVGQSWKDSLSIGALMNTRGLMELIVLNIGYDLGILSPTMFAMLVLMALVTTFITGPSLSLINFIFKEKEHVTAQIPVKPKRERFRVLISFGLANSGRKLLRLATQMLGHKTDEVEYTAIHVTLSSDVSLMNVEDFERQSFRPILNEAEKLNIELRKEYKTTPDLHKEVNQVIEKESVNLLLIGAGKSLYTGSLLGNIVGVTKSISENLLSTITGARPLLPSNDLIDEKARNFVLESACDVGVLIDRDFSDSGTIFLPVFSDEDAFLLNYARKFILHSGSEVTVADTSGLMIETSILQEKYNRILHDNPGKLSMMNDRIIHKEFLARQELMIISYKSWKALVESKSLWLDFVPSVLIIRPLIQ